MYSLKCSKEGHLHEISIGRSKKDDKKTIIYFLNKKDVNCPWDKEASSSNNLCYLRKMEKGQVVGKIAEG